MGGTDEKQNEYKSLRTRREPATAPAWVLSWGIEMVKTENRNPGEMFHFRVYHSFASPASEALLLSSSSAQPSCRRRSLVFIPLVAIRYPLVDVHLHTTHRPQRHRQLSTDDGKRKIAGKKEKTSARGAPLAVICIFAALTRSVVASG